MLKKFATRELIFLTLVGVLLFLLDFAVSGVSVAVGIPGAGGLINAIFFVGLATVGGLIVRKFGAYTLMSFIYGVLAAPTQTFGPPGIYKIVLVIFLGLIADLVIFLFRYKQRGYYFSLTIANVLSIPVGLIALTYLGLPGAEELRKALWVLIPLYAVESVIGAWVGISLYNKKIWKMKIVNQIAS